jgi:glycosyltransferase involved in cell wall biosynthesis
MAPTDNLERKSATVSVVVPNFNHAHFLPRAIERLLGQHTPPDEIIIIDDGSTDNSPALVLDIARNHATVRPYLLDKNQGTVACMNHGLAVASGKYVCFAASDDLTEPHFFSLAVDALERDPRAAFFCAEINIATLTGEKIGVRPIVRPSWTPRYFAPTEVKELLLRVDQFIATSSAVFRREHLSAAGGFDASLKSMADTHAARRLALINGFCFRPSVVCTLTLSQSSQSRLAAHDPDAAIELMTRGRAAIEAEPIYPEGYAELFERRWRFATSRIALTETLQWHEFVMNVGARNRLDRLVLKACAAIPAALGSGMALIWLTIRLRPYFLTSIGATALQRMLERLRARV